MRYPAVRGIFLVLAISGCHAHNYRVADPKAQPTVVGISAYPTAVVEVSTAPGIELDAEDMTSFANAIVERVRAVKVIADVQRAPANADLAIRVRVTKMERKEHWSLQNGTTVWYDAAVDVELYDAPRTRVLDRFSLTAKPGSAFEMPRLKDEPLTVAMNTLINIAYGIAGQVKRRK